MPTLKQASPQKTATGSRVPLPAPSQSHTARSAIPRLTGASKQLPSRQATRTLSSGKRPHPSSSQAVVEASEPDLSSNPRAPKIPRTSPPTATSTPRDVDGSSNSRSPNEAGLYPSGRRIPTPLLVPTDPSASGAATTHAPEANSSRPRNAAGRFITRQPTPPPRESSVKTEDMEDEIEEEVMDVDQLDENGEDENTPAPEANEDYGSDDSCGWSYEEYTIPTQRGSPSPELRYQRSFTKLGQRKPTPRRIILPDEGDLSAMAKTVYYEHDEDQVEPPSPSPKSRRRAVRAREKERAAAADAVQPIRILDGLDAPEDDEHNHEEDQASKGQPHNAETPLFFEYDESGYVYDPRGFGVLEEIPPNSSSRRDSSASNERSPRKFSEPTRYGAPQNTTVRDIDHDLQSGNDEQRDLAATAVEHVVPTNSGDTSATQHVSDISDSKDDVSVGAPPGKSIGLTLSATPRPPSRASGHAVVSEMLSQDDVQSGKELLSNGGVRTGAQDSKDGSGSGEEESMDESFDPDVVILRSGNPKAAAKAAAILRMHHPYVVEEGDHNPARVGRPQSRRERSPHRHSRTSNQSRSRSRARPDHFGDVSMPDLIDEVEVELTQNIVRPGRTASPSRRPVLPPDTRQGDSGVPPVASTSSAGAGPSSQPGSTGFDPWTKDDWKNLERCFIQERKVIAQRMQLATSKDVDPSHVDTELVVERFKGFLIASKQFKSGPDWDRRKLVLRTSVLAKRLAKMMKDAQDTALGEVSQLRETATPSTFGDEYDYDRSLTLSRQSSVGGSSSASGLYPQLHAPFAERFQSASRKVSSSSSSTAATRNTVPAQGISASSSTTSRLLGYLGLGRPSATPPPADAEAHFKRPLPRTSSTTRSQTRSTTSPTSPTIREMSQIRRDGPIPLVAPLRRASAAPMKDPEVRILREREARPILRHAEPPSSRETSRSRSISITTSISPNARGLSSSSSVRDLVRSFEELTEETSDSVRYGTPRSQSQGVTPPPRPRWSDGSSGSDDKPSIASRSADGRSGVDDSLPLEDRSYISSNVREIIVPGLKLIPSTAAPHKKRMSFLGPWRS